MTLSVSGTNGITLDGQFNSASSMGFKNRIINGAMVIDQRNAGAAVTGISSGTNYITDRFTLVEATDAVFTAQQDTSAPSGFVNSLKITTTTADASIDATQYVFVAQRIEGTNTSDFGWGASGASTVTLSFWVRSSLTGTFSGTLSNSAFNYSYAFEYNISAADTWEKKTITISGSTAGIWLTTTGIGVQVIWSLGHGSNFDGTANTWESAGDIGTSGSVAVASNLNATFYITGVQLEKGSTATSFDYRPYGTELALCQRYYSYLNRGLVGGADSATTIALGGICVVPMRASPTIALMQTTPQFISGGTIFSGTASAITDSNLNFDSYHLRLSGFTGLTTGRACIARNGSGGGLIELSSEL